MTIVLHHHPRTRAAGVVWMLEEVGVDYRLEAVDFATGAHKAPAFTGLNPMGKIPTLLDGEIVVTESAAIGLYLADRHALGRLAPAPDSPARGPYLRWSFYAPSVIEPGCMARAAKWDFKAGQAGWGTYEAMCETIERAIGDGPWLLGEEFSMADVVFGGTVRWMVGFGMLEARGGVAPYLERLDARPAWARSQEVNRRALEERGLDA